MAAYLGKDVEKEGKQVWSPSTTKCPQHIKAHAMTENDLEKLQEEKCVTRLEQFLFKSIAIRLEKISKKKKKGQSKPCL